MLEREVKVRFSDPDHARAALTAIGAVPLRPRRLQVRHDEADTADRLRVVGGSVAELAPLVQLMLRLAAQAAERPGDNLPLLAELVARARRARAGDPYDLTMIAIVALVTGRVSDARDLLAELAADARAQGRIGWLPTMLTCLAQAGQRVLYKAL